MNIFREKRNIIVLILAVMMLIYGGQTISYSQEQNNAPEFTPVCDRTQQVRDAIVALVPGVDDCKDVTSTHLAVISNLNLSNQEISALKAGDFDGLSALTSLSIGNNQLTNLPTNIFSGLSSLTRLDLGSNQLSSLHEDIFSDLSSLNRIYLYYNSLSSLPEDIFSGLSSLQSLALGNNNLSSLPAGIFSGLSALDWLTLSSNSLSELPDGIFSGLSSLRSLSLTENSIDLSITVSLEKVGDSQFKAITPIGAPFDIVLPLIILNGGIFGDATTITISTGNVESDLFNVGSTPNTTDPVTVEIGTLPSLPTSHYGYRIVKPTTTEEDDNTLSFAIAVIPDYQPTTNTPPVFIEGESTTRSIPENTPPGVNIGGPLSAEQAASGLLPLLTYTLGGVDAASFDIDSGTGQLKTSAPLDYETKTTYSVIATVSDGQLTDSINITINVTDINENNAPVFTEGERTSRSIAENTPASENIGEPVIATDLDEEDVLTYTLVGIDAVSFSIDAGTGQLKTSAPLDYETKTTYSVIATVSDGQLTDTINVTINVTDINENNAPVFTEGERTSRSIAENTSAGEKIGEPVVATDLDEEDVLTYTLGGIDAASFGIDSGTAQLLTKAPLDYETKDAYAVVVSVSDGKGGTDSISVTIYATDVFENNPPVFTEGDSTSRSIAENTSAGEKIGEPVIATDLDEEDILTYTLGGIDAASFGIEAAIGQLLTKAPLDYETKDAYAVVVSVSDGKGGTDSISVTIYATDVFENNPPVFTEGDSTSRSIAENTSAGEKIGEPIIATDLDEEDVLTYTLAGIDAVSFGIDSGTAQLLTKAPLDYETKDTYAVVVSVSDGKGGTDTISVTIYATDVFENNPPVFTEGDSTSRSIAENTSAGEKIGEPVVATDLDEEDVLTYTLGGIDAASFGIGAGTGQLLTKAPLDFETKDTYVVIVSVSDGKDGTDTINVTIYVTDVFENNPPVFTEGESTSRSIAENTSAGEKIGEPVIATDLDEEDVLTYTLGGIDAASFGIGAGTGQLLTKAPLDYETKDNYAVIVSVSDRKGGTDTINVTIYVTDVFENNPPVFTEGGNTSRSIAENTSTGENIGEPVVATDLDEEDVLTYTLAGIDAASFGIGAGTGQLLTKAPLDFETKDTYAVIVSVSDGKDGTDTINVTIYVTDVFENNPPVFTEGESTSRSIAENTSAGEKIGEPIIATDLDEEDVLTYTLGGIDAASFGIGAGTGQLLTKAPLDYETKDNYAVVVSVSDGKGGTDTINVTIYVTDVFENNPPIFTEGESTSRSIAENTSAGEKIGEPIIATDLDEEDVLTYTLGGIDAASFGIGAGTGQLLTKAPLDFETKDNYAVVVSVSDGKDGTDSISVTIYVTGINENNPPVFTEGDSTSRSIAENTSAGEKIGEPVIATDLDEEDVLTYTLGGIDAASFGIEAAIGQLLTKAPLDYETKDAYAVVVSVSDGKGGTDSISVTIYATDVFENNPPVFTEGDSTSRSIAENTSAGEKIGEPIIATDLDEEDVLTYTLGGIDAASFGIEAAAGQLLTKAPLDYETKDTYAVIVSVSDGKGGTDSISVTIYVTDVFENNPPVFTEGDSTSRSIAENTSAGENIGEPVIATDLDEEDVLTYTLGGIDAASFGIGAGTGQLLTKAPLDYETKDTYAVIVSVSDGKGGTDSISVTIYVTDVFENNPPVFTEGDSTSRSIAENTSAGENIGEPVIATDLDEEDVLTYTLGGIDAASFGIEAGTGQLLTKAPLDYETKDAYAVVVSVSDGKGGTDSISVTIYATDVFENNPPVFTEGDSTSRSIAENTSAGGKIGEPVVATDLDEEDILTYTLGGIDAVSFSIEAATGQLLTKAPLDFETKDAYAVVVSVSDGKGGTDTINVTIYVTDVFENNAPIFTEGDSTSRSIAENTSAGENIGEPVVATDLDEEDILTYTLAGVDAASFSIEAATGQLKTRAALDFETKNTYAASVSASDGKGGTDSISVTIYVTDVFENNPPVFTEGDSTSRSIAENTSAGEKIGEPIVATDLDEEDILTYTLAGVDAASFSIEAATGQLKTRAALDFETKNTYAASVSVSDGKGGTDSISVTIYVTDVFENNPPVFTEGDNTSRSIAENTSAGENIGEPIVATDLDEEDILTYTLAGVDAASFSIEAATGQLKTRAALDFETKNTYAASVSVSDGKGGTDIINVTINVTDIYENRPPVFAYGETTTRSIVENTPAGRNIGDPVTATDPDENDTLTYSLSGTDADTFSIGAATGQLLTHASLDFETKSSYTVTVTVSDGSQSVTVVVTIIVIDVNESRAPAFADDRTTRSIAENTHAGVNIGSAVTATDSDGDTLTYSLEGTDATTFSIVSSTGQLKTLEELDFETRNSYTVTVTVSDGRFTASIAVTITIIDVDETPPPEPEPSRVSISEIMYGSESGSFSPEQWIELHNTGPDLINLAGWKLIIQNVDSPELTGPVNMIITFKSGFFSGDDAPRIWPNDVVMVVGASDSHSDNLIDDQIYNLSWLHSLAWYTKWLSTEGFRIKLYDDEGNLVDDAGNLDGDTLLWKLPYGQNRGKTRAGHRTSLIRRYADSMPLDGTQAASWISAGDANLTPDLITYYGDSDDISTSGVGIVINEISSQYSDYDINQDGVVNISDLVIVAGRLGQSGPNPADVNGDGVVNVQDLILVAGAIGQTSTAPSLHPASVPMLTATDIQEWLTAAQGLDLTNVTLQSGIRFLEQLLQVLIPQQTELLPNFPNPFNPETWIPYRLAEDGFVTLTIYDQSGVVIRKFDVGHKTAAVYETRSSAIHWNGRNEVGDKVASGIYFYTLTAGNYTATRKMLILK